MPLAHLLLPAAAATAAAPTAATVATDATATAIATSTPVNDDDDVYETYVDIHDSNYDDNDYEHPPPALPTESPKPIVIIIVGIDYNSTKVL